MLVSMYVDCRVDNILDYARTVITQNKMFWFLASKKSFVATRKPFPYISDLKSMGVLHGKMSDNQGTIGLTGCPVKSTDMYRTGGSPGVLENVLSEFPYGSIRNVFYLYNLDYRGQCPYFRNKM